jgi:two-component system chemotaxis sensor kinase CheA
VTRIDLEQFKATFFEEAFDHLAAIERGVLALEAAPRDPEQLNAVFRAAHSIKGASGTFGLDEVMRFTHVLESLLDRLRDGRLSFSREIGDLLLESNDVLRDLMIAARDGTPPARDADAVSTRLAGFADATPSESAPRPTETAASNGAPARHRVVFTPGADLLRQGMDPLLLLRELAELADVIRVEQQLESLPSLAAMDPETCYLGWALELVTQRSREQILDVFAFVEDTSQIAIERADGAPGEHQASSTTTAPAPARAMAPPRAASGEITSIRVATEKVDRLINLVGELVITQSMISDVAKDFGVEKLVRLREAVGEMERTTRELQERVMAVRMVPIGSVFSRFPRVVRDLSASCGKEIDLEITGGETELDKSVVEQIGDPLMHIVRNAVDHGIEPPDERARMGKPSRGLLTLSACHQGGSVVLEIADDGRGLDTERIREKAVAAGVVESNEKLTTDQIHALIFTSGLSTARVVSDISGRGVGMDVVKRNIEALGGTVGITSSPGRGSCFRIRLPLTLAILDGLTLRVGEGTFIVPLIAVVESLQPRREQLRSVLGQGEVVVVRGQPVPLIRLHRVLGLPGETTDPTCALVVIVEQDDGLVALLVDDVLGQQQVVIKSLERNFRRTEGISAATILGDGRVALILDVPGLVACRRSGVTNAIAA